MAYREDTKVTPAEAASFLLVPETCDAMDAALLKLGTGPSNDAIDKELRSYHVEPTREIRNAVVDLYARHMAVAIAEARQAVLMRGTFPLRLALVREIEKQMPVGQPESRYVRWLQTWGRPQATGGGS